MDDMVFQNNNKNAIYILNTNYNAYEDLSCSSLFGYHQLNSDEINNNSRSCSFSKSLHKLKSLRQNSSEMILVSGANVPEGNSSATTSCSPAAVALQKLFNCNSAAYSCRNITHKNKNDNCHTVLQPTSQEIEKLKEHMTQPSNEYHNQNHSPLLIRSNTGAGCMLNCVGGSSSVNDRNKKKYSTSTASVKSALIAKKTKFWKYLVEEEKWQKHRVDSLSTTNCERDCIRSNGKLTPSNFSNATDNHNKYIACDTHCGGVKQAEVDTIPNHPRKTRVGSSNGDSNRINNWSGNIDMKESNSNSNQKSSAELYKEAAQLLGLSCTLCDNCRCLDCQSRYFECDDSDSYSEFSFMDDVDRSPNDLHFSSQSLQCDGENSISDICRRGSCLNRNLLDRCNSFKDLSLGNSAESQD